MALKSYNKLGFVDGSITAPSKNSSHYAAWEIVNSLLCPWIWNSLDSYVRVVNFASVWFFTVAVTGVFLRDDLQN